MKSEIIRNPDKSIDITVFVPWTTISDKFTQIVNESVKNVEVAGFRKGKAPKDIAEKSLDKSKLYEKVIEQILPSLYQEAIQMHNIRPIMQPQIVLKKAKENEEWEILIKTCEQPEINLGNYKEKMKLAPSVNKKIWLPGEKPDPKTEKDQKPSIDNILDTLFSSVKINLPSILLDQEVNRLLSNLVEQTQKVGITIDQYLASTKKTMDSVKQEYLLQARKTLSLEFALEAISNAENITVSEEEINQAINKIENPEEKKALEKERYYIASILRRQKTIDFLSHL